MTARIPAEFHRRRGPKPKAAADKYMQHSMRFRPQTLRRLRSLAELRGQSISAAVVHAVEAAYRALTQEQLDLLISMRFERSKA